MLCALHLLLLQLAACAVHASAPHIVFILADDLGWNDVGFHGSNQIPTSNIDALAMSGQALHKYYVTPICTPSRAALMTGKYPIHTGMQHGVLYGAEPRGLPLTEKILPQYLKELGYKTHLIGKWHLGSYKKEYLPLNRGFDSHLGFWTGKIDMYDHTTMEQGSWGFDFRRDFKLADNLFGKYVTDIYTDEAVRVIRSHNTSQPLFLMMAHSAVHSGNPYEPLRAPEAIIEQLRHINDTQRRKFAAMMWKLDESVGKVVEALQASGLLRDAIIVFSTDNGGPAAGFNSNAASNYPLRGVKNTLWEGGIRAAGCVWSPRLRGGLVSHVPIHVADWLPTLYAAAGGNLSSLGDIDGLSQWDALSGHENPPRTSFVHNIDDIWGSSSITVGDWKIVNGTNYDGQWDNWYGPSGREGSYDVQAVLTSAAAKAIAQVAEVPNAERIATMRAETTVMCDCGPALACSPLQQPCLFNTTADPCEQRNLADSEPEILQSLLQALESARGTAIPPNNQPMDARGDPRFWGRVYTNFGDYESLPDATARI